MPTLTLDADMVDSAGWSHEQMVNCVSEFLKTAGLDMKRCHSLEQLVVVLCAAWSFASVALGATTLTYATPYGPNHTFSRADKTWMRWVEEHSGGSLSIRPIWSGGAAVLR